MQNQDTSQLQTENSTTFNELKSWKEKTKQISNNQKKCFWKSKLVGSLPQLFTMKSTRKANTCLFCLHLLQNHFHLGIILNKYGIRHIWGKKSVPTFVSNPFMVGLISGCIKSGLAACILRTFCSTLIHSSKMFGESAVRQYVRFSVVSYEVAEEF